MTTAILTQSEATNASLLRVESLPLNPRVIAIAVSLVGHLGFAMMAYAHSPAQHRASHVETSVQAIEISVSEVEHPISASRDPLPPSEARLPSQRIAAAPSIIAPAIPVTGSSGTPTVASASVPSTSTADSPNPPTLHFVVQAPVVLGSGTSAAVASPASGSSEGENAPFAERQVDSPAKLRSGAAPSYTAAAESAGIEAELPLEVVIDRAGAVTAARALEHVGYGLDEAALAAVKRYVFSPALRAGRPVSVRMRWLLRFQLR